MYVFTSLAWYLAIFTSKCFTKIPSSVSCCFSVSARTTDRTGRPELVSRTCTLVHVCRPTVRSTDWKQFCSRVFWVDRPVDRLQKTVFHFRGRSTERSTRVQRLLASRAGGRPDQSTARPAKSPTTLSSLVQSEICFWQTFSEFLEIFSRSNKLKIN